MLSPLSLCVSLVEGRSGGKQFDSTNETARGVTFVGYKNPLFSVAKAFKLFTKFE